MIAPLPLQGYGRGRGLVPVQGFGRAAGAVFPGGADFEQDLVGFIRTTLEVRVYPGHIPQKAALPAASYQLLDADRETRMSGATGIVNASYRLVVASEDYLQVNAMTEAIRRGLHSRIQKKLGNTLVFTALLDDQSMDYTPSVDASDSGVYEKTSDYLISYREPLPPI